MSPHVEIKRKRFEAGHNFYTFPQQELDFHNVTWEGGSSPIGKVHASVTSGMTSPWAAFFFFFPLAMEACEPNTISSKVFQN